MLLTNKKKLNRAEQNAEKSHCTALFYKDYNTIAVINMKIKFTHVFRQDKFLLSLLGREEKKLSSRKILSKFYLGLHIILNYLPAPPKKHDFKYKS